MDTPAQESCETGQGSSPGQTSIQGCELNYFRSEATKEKHGISTENGNKCLPENRAAECNYTFSEQVESLREDQTKSLSSERLEQGESAILNSYSEQLGLLPGDVAKKNWCAKQDMLELNHGLVPDSLNSQTLQERESVHAESVQNGSADTGMMEFNYFAGEQTGLPSEDITKSSGSEQPRWHEDVAMDTSLEQLKVSPHVSENCDLNQLAPPLEDAPSNSSKAGARGRRTSTKSIEGNDVLRSSVGSTRVLRSRSQEKSKTPELSNGLVECGDDVSKTCDLKKLEVPTEDAANTPRKSGGRIKKGKLTLRSTVGSTRVLRSMSQEKSKAPEPSNNLSEQGDTADNEKRRKNRKKKRVKKTPVDEFSRIRARLRYLLNRMNYEQNLIDAYSGEGWKGQSLEKIKPEKELQRAKSEILRCKLKLRDLFQRLDSSISVGRFPESLYDSDGQIDSEDIFCAKCGSKDLPADNDIILCDGACERGFHQFCLEPPLLKEHIPPGDQGWLCPGCDCKVDCIDLLNDSQGTKLSLADSWEKVFPEAAAAAAGNKLDDSLGLPSDDSEDNDYDPDNSDVDEVEGDESSSDESDLRPASEDPGACLAKKQNADMSSDDSEDDDYDPNAPELDEQVKEVSSSSDFTSDSEDFGVALDEGNFLGKDETMHDKPMPIPLEDSKPSKDCDGERSRISQRKQSLNVELSSLLELGPSQGESTPLPAKRHVERLDYRKLHDETYGNDSSDSSDEDYMNSASKGRRTNDKDNVALESPGGRNPTTNATDMKHPNEGSEHGHKRRARKKLHAEGALNSTAKSYKGSPEPGSSCNSTKKSTYKRLGEAVTEGLLKAFKENQYPDRGTKENLAKELGISVYQVSKWFENARWSFRHTTRMESKLVEGATDKGAPPRINPSHMGSKTKAADFCNGVKNKEPSKVNASATMGNRFTGESSGQTSIASRGRKRKGQLNNQPSTNSLSIKETKAQSKPVDSAKTQEAQERGRPKTRKSAT